MKFKALMIILLVCLLTGCCEFESSDYEGPTRYFKAISSERDGKIIYDTRTGVEYWMTYGTHNVLTVLVDADGKPLIHDGREENDVR
jgi:hypothetical protein